MVLAGKVCFPPARLRSCWDSRNPTSTTLPRAARYRLSSSDGPSASTLVTWRHSSKRLGVEKYHRRPRRSPTARRQGGETDEPRISGKRGGEGGCSGGEGRVF